MRASRHHTPATGVTNNPEPGLDYRGPLPCVEQATRADLAEGTGQHPSPRTMREVLARATMKAHTASPAQLARDRAIQPKRKQQERLVLYPMWLVEEAEQRYQERLREV